MTEQNKFRCDFCLQSVSVPPYILTILGYGNCGYMSDSCYTICRHCYQAIDQFHRQLMDRRLDGCEICDAFWTTPYILNICSTCERHLDEASDSKRAIAKESR